MEERRGRSQYEDEESEALLDSNQPPPTADATSRTRSRMLYVVSFGAGIFACILVRLVSSPLLSSHSTSEATANRSHFPPSDPINWEPSLFPSDVGYPGPTPTGAEPAVLATASAYPIQPGSHGLLVPSKIQGTNGSDGFNLFRSWGNLSPWYSVPSAEFGLPEAGVDAPEKCSITGLHFLHRHGARLALICSSTKWNFMIETAQISDVRF